MGCESSKSECKTNYPELIETQAECLSTYPAIGSSTDPSTGGTNNPTQVCSTTTCNGDNRTKKSASEISAIPSSISCSEYSDTTFRSPCCKWYNLPAPEGISNRPNVNYTDFLNTQITCPINTSADDNGVVNTSITPWTTVATNTASGAAPRRCGGFTINADADQNMTHPELLTNSKFQIKFTHDHPTNTNQSCDFSCACPQNEEGKYWTLGQNNWHSDADGVSAQIRCVDE